MIKSLLVVVAFFSITSFAYQINNISIEELETVEDLDSLAAFSFAIMSDNKGKSPQSNVPFANMVEWVAASDDKFVIGVGDHVKKGYDNTFLKFLDDNEWWYDNFYPNVADGENEYYGDGQGDWGAGSPILDTVSIRNKPYVNVHDNDCEYYARIPVDDYTVHLIQLHYSDTPEDPALAFTDDSHKYLIETLESIDKTNTDIIIAAAHSRYGFWIDQLTDDERDTVMSKCDMVLSATTHFFGRMNVSGYDSNEALCINTGSISYPYSYCPPGYVQVHVLQNPDALVVEYIDCSLDARELQSSYYAYVKLLGGPVLGTSFRDLRKEDDPDYLIGYNDRAFTKEETTEELKAIYLSITDAEIAYISANTGIAEGDFARRKLWKICPYNNEIYALTLTAEQVDTIFDSEIDTTGKDNIKIALNSWLAQQIISELDLPDDKIFRSGVNEIDALAEWVSGL